MRLFKSRRALSGCARVCSILLLSLAAASPAAAQSEGSDVRYVEITSLNVKKEGKKRIIAVKAKAPKLPVGCKVEFLLTWRYQTIEKYVVEVQANHRFEEEFVVEGYTPSPEKYVFRTQLVEPKNQKSKVRKEIQGDEKTFPPGAVPWTEFQSEHEFTLGTAEEIRAEQERIRAWFKERYTEVAGLDRKVSDAAKAVREKTDYVDKKGEFQEKKWRTLMDQEVLKVLKKLQDDVREGLKGKKPELLSYRRPLADLRELANAVAWRTTSKSVELYKELGLDPEEADVKHEGVETTVRGFKRTPPKSKHLGKLVKSINTALGVGVPEGEKAGSR